MSDVFEKKEVQLDKRTKVVVEWMYDTDSDLSWLGAWTDKEHEYVIDRVKGVFLGKLKEFGDIEVPLSDLITTLQPALVDEDGDLTSAAWDAAQRYLEAKATDLGMWFGDSDDSLEVRFDDEKQVFYVNDTYHYEILAKYLGRTCYDSSREYRYWEPGCNYNPPKDADEVRYCLADWKRMEDYNNQGWFMSGCQATVYIDGIEVGQSYGLWGIESDSDAADKREIEEGQILDALQTAQDNASLYGRVARKLRAMNQEKIIAALKDAEVVLE
jgi:hypothetical protein